MSAGPKPGQKIPSKTGFFRHPKRDLTLLRDWPRPLAAEILLSDDVKEEKRGITGIIEKHGAVKSKDFKRFWGNTEVKKSLRRHHEKKCCCRGRKIHWKREYDVAHFRPKSGVREEETLRALFDCGLRIAEFEKLCPCRRHYDPSQFGSAHARRFIPTGPRDDARQ